MRRRFCAAAAAPSLTAPRAAQSDVEPLKVPFVGGSDCIGVVSLVGAGVKDLNVDDWVIPMKPGMGTWRSLAVWKEKDLRKLPAADLLPTEYAAMLRACPRDSAAPRTPGPHPCI